MSLDTSFDNRTKKSCGKIMKRKLEREPMMSSVAGLMIGNRLLRRGTFHSPSMKSCLLGMEIAIFLFSLLTLCYVIVFLIGSIIMQLHDNIYK